MEGRGTAAVRGTADILGMTAGELILWLNEYFDIGMPERVETVEEAREASRMLMEYAQTYSYVLQLSVELKDYARRMRRESQGGGDGAKERYDRAAGLRDAADAFADGIKMRYQAISRAVTIRSDNLGELHMSDTH